MTNIFTDLVSNIEERIQSALQSAVRLNLQLFPSRTRVILNDKDSKMVFSLDDSNVQSIVRSGTGVPVVQKKHKKHGVITGVLNIYNGAEFRVTEALDQFDFAVFSVCLSEMFEGNFYTTPAIINRALTGKIARNAELHPNQRAAIMHSLQKLIGTVIRVNLADYCQKLKVPSQQMPIFGGSVLPAQYMEATVNGKDITLIHFSEDMKSPLLRAAELKGQILRYDATLLDVPLQNNTPRVITLKSYVMRRLAEISAHKELAPVITFDDVFKKCRIPNSTKAKLDARNSITMLCNHLLNKKFIKSFELIRKGNHFHAMKFATNPKAIENVQTDDTGFGSGCYGL